MVLLLAKLITQSIRLSWDGDLVGVVEFQTGVIEGGPHSMTCLNAALEFLLAPIVHSWKERGIGFQLKCDPNNEASAYVCHSLQNWVDDFFLFARTPSELQLMLDEFEDALIPLGVKINRDKLEWMCVGKHQIEDLQQGEGL